MLENRSFALTNHLRTVEHFLAHQPDPEQNQFLILLTFSGVAKFFRLLHFEELGWTTSHYDSRQSEHEENDNEIEIRIIYRILKPSPSKNVGQGLQIRSSPAIEPIKDIQR